MSWRVNLDLLALIGGGRALLLQVAHPLVAAGVEQFSDYQGDPWARLGRTLDVIFKLAFATPEVSRRQARVLRARHSRVQGRSAEGVSYRALDPALLLWVWATLVNTSLVVHERCHGRLSPTDRERFYQEQKLLAYACGVATGQCPATAADFDTYFATVVSSTLRVTPEARRVAAAVTGPLLRGPIDLPVRGLNRLVTAGLLPPSLRESYGFEWSLRHERHLARVFGMARTISALVPAAVLRAPTRLLLTRDRPLVLPRVLQRR